MAKKRKSYGNTQQQSKMGRAAQACAGRKASAFRACVRSHLRK